MDEDLIIQQKKSLSLAYVDHEGKALPHSDYFCPNQHESCHKCNKPLDIDPGQTPEQFCAFTLKDMKMFGVKFSLWNIKLRSLLKIFNFFSIDFFDNFKREEEYIPNLENMCKECFVHEIKDIRHGFFEKEWHAQHCKRCFLNYAKALSCENCLENYAENGTLPAELCHGCPIVFGPHLKRLYRPRVDPN